MTAADVFAFGRVMLELFTRTVPFFYISQDLAIMKRVGNGEIPTRPQDNKVVAGGLDDSTWRLMTDCWDIDPSRRPCVEDVVSRLNAALGARDRAERDHSLRPMKQIRSYA